jgi:hypothetical protein
MADGYRITVRGEMSERFCRGFLGLVGRSASGRTVLEGGAAGGPPIHRVLSKLDNLGLEVLDVERMVATPHPKEG